MENLAASLRNVVLKRLMPKYTYTPSNTDKKSPVQEGQFTSDIHFTWKFFKALLFNEELTESLNEMSGLGKKLKNFSNF